VSSGAVVSSTPSFGADGPDGSTPKVYSLDVGNSNSGLHVTDGSAINLTKVGDVVVGVVSGGAFNGQAAFAISINATPGAVTVEQYLSLHQDSLTNTPDDAMTLATGSLNVKVTVTDGDGDQASNSADVSAQITFHDDGPSVTATGTPPTLNVDESFLTAATN